MDRTYTLNTQNKGQSLKDRLLSGGLWVAGGKLFSFLSQLTVNALLARLLAPKEMGLYFLILSLVNFFMMFALLGMKRSIVRIVSKSLALGAKENANQAVHNMLQIGLLSSVSFAVILYSGVGQFVSLKIFGSKLIGNMMILPAIWLVLYTLQTLIAEAFRGYHNIRSATIFNGLICSALSAMALVYLFGSGMNVDLQTVLKIIISAFAVNLILSIITLRRQTGPLLRSSRASITRTELLKNSWLLYFTNIVLFVMTTGHLWLLAYFSTKENVAIFGAVWRLMVIITTSMGMVRLTILPTIGELYAKKQYSKVERVLRVSASIAGLPAILGLGLIILLGKDLLLIIYGAHYTMGYNALVVIATASLINVFTGTPAPLIVMASKEKYLLYFALSSGFIGMVVSFFLIERMECLGVAIGMGIGIVLHNILMVWYCKSRLSIWTLMSLREVVSFLSSIKGKYFRHTLPSKEY